MKTEDLENNKLVTMEEMEENSAPIDELVESAETEVPRTPP